MEFLLATAWPYVLALLGVVAAWFAGAQSGRKDERERAEYDRARSREIAREVEREHDQKPIDSVRRDSARWVRDDTEQ